ncbi:hypothetical protein CHLNCDRAFT_19060 [Chlorella variabilis]|uniref:Uncharacterized protein n=1 Tax=Chlorella variabilis TaxID=554065 RepID=E1Z4U7_CHLVA|nr:hypothetical protein CHLNCDRAFT_19060 [Chlorella variabilis]EFN59120.1 hypothetical protein CHLNCDRAFT_19060 [Chlorella variabilis]|eukprot:XP_005851222.1 hypothetical protein CHLNCDRAFT_19060 [Chlorella variabilis]
MRWVELASKGDVPQARSSHSITAVGDRLYLWGGESAPRVPISTDMHAYDMQAAQWSLVQAQGTPPSLRNAHAAAAIGAGIYIFGGRSGIDIGEGSLNDLHRFDAESATWVEVRPASEAVPPKRSYHAMAAAQGRLYVFGGCGEGSTGRLNDLWEFDLSTATWRQLPSSDAIKASGNRTLGRGGAGFAAVPCALFVVAGFAGQEMGDVHRQGRGAGPPGGSSSCGHDQPVALPARSVCAVAAHGCAGCLHSNHIVVFGGEVDPSTQGHAGAGCYSADTFCLDTACGHWHSISAGGQPPSPRGWLAATACGTGVVVHGGNSASNQRLADMFLLEMH